jgi:hypothetical protein
MFHCWGREIDSNDRGIASLRISFDTLEPLAIALPLPHKGLAEKVLVMKDGIDRKIGRPTIRTVLSMSLIPQWSPIKNGHESE